MDTLDYWKESISIAADECGLILTDAQLQCLAESAEGAHEHYGMAFYSPPASDRIAVIEREWEAKFNAEKSKAEQYRHNAETAIKQALRQPSDASVGIGEYGEVFRYGGRTEQIQ